MPLPKPVPGLVIRYSWHREHLAGRDEGQKDRPCAIIAAITVDAANGTRVLVLPITDTPPDQSIEAIEIPAPVKKRLGFDGSPS